MSIVSLLVRAGFLAVLMLPASAEAQCTGGCNYGYCSGSTCNCYPGGGSEF
jgi:hypothetical protein